MKIRKQPLGDRGSFRAGRTRTLQPLDQQDQRLPVSENLASLDLPRVDPRKPRRSLSLPNQQTQTAPQRTTIALAHKLSRTKRKLRTRPRISPLSESPIEISWLQRSLRFSFVQH